MSTFGEWIFSFSTKYDLQARIIPQICCLLPAAPLMVLVIVLDWEGARCLVESITSNPVLVAVVIAAFFVVLYFGQLFVSRCGRQYQNRYREQNTVKYPKDYCYRFIRDDLKEPRFKANKDMPKSLSDNIKKKRNCQISTILGQTYNPDTYCNKEIIATMIQDEQYEKVVAQLVKECADTSKSDAGKKKDILTILDLEGEQDDKYEKEVAQLVKECAGKSEINTGEIQNILAKVYSENVQEMRYQDVVEKLKNRFETCANNNDYVMLRIQYGAILNLTALRPVWIGVSIISSAAGLFVIWDCNGDTEAIIVGAISSLAFMVFSLHLARDSFPRCVKEFHQRYSKCFFRLLEQESDRIRALTHMKSGKGRHVMLPWTEH